MSVWVSPQGDPYAYTYYYIRVCIRTPIPLLGGDGVRIHVYLKDIDTCTHIFCLSGQNICSISLEIYLRARGEEK